MIRDVPPSAIDPDRSWCAPSNNSRRARISLEDPMARIRSPPTRTDASNLGGAPVPSMTVTLWMRREGVSSAADDTIT